MITAAQLRAARGLLNWTRTELAKASGISAETIKNIEHGLYTPQESTVAAIVSGFAAHDVEFTEGDGVRKCTNIVINYEGKQDFRRYADDIYTILLDNPANRKIYVFGNNDKEFIDALGDYADVHLQRMSRMEGLVFRSLVLEGIDVMVTKYIEYRRLKDIPFAIPFSVYENRFDFIMYGEGKSFPRVVAIKSEPVAAAYRAQFEAMWKLSKPITK